MIVRLTNQSRIKLIVISLNLKPEKSKPELEVDPKIKNHRFDVKKKTK